MSNPYASVALFDTPVEIAAAIRQVEAALEAVLRKDGILVVIEIIDAGRDRKRIGEGRPVTASSERRTYAEP